MVTIIHIGYISRYHNYPLQAGYFCLFFIVENPETKYSELDIRLPVFKDGLLQSIDSYMEHFPFQHYIVLRWPN